MSEYMGEQVVPALKMKFDQKQDKLVSGASIKTINGESILGEGDINIEPSVAVPQFTNDVTGTIKGSTTDGAIAANADGTGSVNGFAEVKEGVADAKTMANAAASSATAAATAANMANNKAIEALDRATKIAEPVIPDAKVATKAALDAVATTGFAGGETYEVEADETQDGRSTIYVWNVETKQWDLDGEPSPYVTKSEYTATISRLEAEIEALKAA